MWIFVLGAFLLAALFALWGISLFTRINQVPMYVMIPLFLAIYIPYSIVVLVPIDLMSSNQSSHPLFYIDERIRLMLWRVSYWLAFVLTWLLLPLLQYYVESGYHDPMKKIRESIKRNAQYQGILLGTGCLGLVYVLLTSGLSLTSVRGLVIALSHCYALVLAIWLLGHGLVNIPRGLWNNASPQALLNHQYRHAVSVSDQYAEAQSRYTDLAAEIMALTPYKNNTIYVEWIDDLIDEVSNGPNLGGSISGRSRVTVEPSMINDGYLQSLGYRHYQAKTRLLRYRADWEKLLKECSKAQDIIRAKGTGKLQFRFVRCRLSPVAAYIYYSFIHTPLRRALAVFLLITSAIIIWSETSHGTMASLVNVIISRTYGIYQQAVSSFFLGYMCVAATGSLTSIRIFNIYALVRRDSDYSSLLWYAMYICRLTVPLSYNYLSLVTTRESVFEEFLGKSINLTPLGKYFNDWLPRLILLPVCLTLFHFYDKIKDWLGFGLSFDDDEDEYGDSELSGAIIEGRELVERSLTDGRFKFALNLISSDNDRSMINSSYRDSLPISEPRREIRSEIRSNGVGSQVRSNEIGSTNGRLDQFKTFLFSVKDQVEEGVDRLRGIIGNEEGRPLAL